MSVASTRHSACILHVGPSAADHVRAVAAQLSATKARVESVGDVYRALALMGTQQPPAAAVVVCVDELAAKELEFFTLAARCHPQTPVYVYGDQRLESRVLRALELGAHDRVQQRTLESMFVAEASSERLASIEPAPVSSEHQAAVMRGAAGGSGDASRSDPGGPGFVSPVAAAPFGQDVSFDRSAESAQVEDVEDAGSRDPHEIDDELDARLQAALERAEIRADSMEGHYPAIHRTDQDLVSPPTLEESSSQSDQDWSEQQATDAALGAVAMQGHTRMPPYPAHRKPPGAQFGELSPAPAGSEEEPPLRIAAETESSPEHARQSRNEVPEARAEPTAGSEHEPPSEDSTATSAPRVPWGTYADTPQRTPPGGRTPPTPSSPAPSTPAPSPASTQAEPDAGQGDETEGMEHLFAPQGDESGGNFHAEVDHPEPRKRDPEPSERDPEPYEPLLTPEELRALIEDDEPPTHADDDDDPPTGGGS